MKGLYKGFKYTLSQIFGITTVQSVDFVKEREMEIGYPTDVKHVAHVGWDGPSGSAPSWMSEFKTGPDFAATSIGNSFSALSPWSSRDFSESMRRQPSESEVFKDASSSEQSNTKKKLKWKKSKSSSSPKSHSSSSSRSSRAGKSKSSFTGGGVKPTNIEVS